LIYLLIIPAFFLMPTNLSLIIGWAKLISKLLSFWMFWNITTMPWPAD